MILKQFIYNFDFFAAVPGFRVKGKPQVLSICGGILSLLLLIFFFYYFINSAVEILNYQSIQAKQITKIAEKGTERIQNIMFGVGIKYFRVYEFTKIMSIRVFQRNSKEDQEDREIPLVECTKQMWQGVEDIQNKFILYELDYMLCPSYNDSFFIEGLESDINWKKIYIVVEYCASFEDDCFPYFYLSYFIQQYIEEHRFFQLNFCLLNTGFNLNSREPVFQYIDNSFLITYSDELGEQIQINLGTYNINTDQTVLPWKQENQQNGYYVVNSDSSVVQLLKINETILSDISISLSRQSLVVQRNFGKLDETLGYVGGLFGIVFALLAFFVMSYNQYRYELMVSEGAFSYEHGEKYRQADFNIFTYVKYSVYDWIRFLTCCEPDWKTCKRIEESRDEANEQLDIKYFMRRIAYLEQMMKLKFSEEEETLLRLSEPATIESVKKNRKIHEYYESVMRGKLHLTISGMRTAKNILQFGLNTENGSKMVLNFNEQILGNKNETLEQYLKNNKKYLEQENESVVLTEQEDEIENYLADMFFRIEDEKLEQIKYSIPLLILHRLHKKSNRPIKVSITKNNSSKIFQRVLNKV